MIQLFANNATTGTSAPISDADTILPVVSGAGFPTPGGGQYFLATLIALDEGGNEVAWEIVRCTLNAGDEFAVVRGQEGTTARAWPAGTRIEARLTAGSLASPTHAHPSTAISDSTAAGRALLTAANAAAQRASLGLGTAATATVTTSTSDSTPGRLLKVGDLGVGGDAILAGYEPNLNDLGIFKLGSTVGAYGYNTGVWNEPSLGIGVVVVWFNVTTIGIPDRVTQIASTPFVYTRRMFVRYKHDADWSKWYEVYTQASILGAVSQSSGAPTGAIIERGSNANGEYVKFADGTQICTNANKAITTNPAAFVGTVTSVDSSKCRIGRWF